MTGLIVSLVPLKAGDNTEKQAAAGLGLEQRNQKGSPGIMRFQSAA